MQNLLTVSLVLFNLLLSLIERNFKLRILYLESIRNFTLPQVQTYLLLQLLYDFILALNRLLKILIDGLGSGELFIDAQRVISQCFQLILLLTIGNFKLPEPLPKMLINPLQLFLLASHKLDIPIKISFHLVKNGNLGRQNNLILLHLAYHILLLTILPS